MNQNTEPSNLSMNINQAKHRIGELQGALDWHHRGQFLLTKYVLTVREEEDGEPLFWSNEEWWQPEISNAQVYDDYTGALIYYDQYIPSEYVLLEEGEKRMLLYRLKSGQYDLERNQHGNSVQRYFYPDIDGRHDSYWFYGAVLKNMGNWVHYKTGQDMPCYRIWYSPELRAVATYTEGDVTLTRCNTIDSFMEELCDLVDFQHKMGYGEEDAINLIEVRDQMEALECVIEPA